MKHLFAYTYTAPTLTWQQRQDNVVLQPEEYKVWYDSTEHAAQNVHPALLALAVESNDLLGETYMVTNMDTLYGVVTRNELVTIVPTNATEDEVLHFSSSFKRRYSIDDVIWSALMGRYILQQFAHHTEDGECIGTAQALRDEDYAIPYGSDEWVHCYNGDLQWCDDIEGYAYSDDTHYCEDCDQTNLNGCYQCDENEERDLSTDHICQYHGTSGMEINLEPESLSSIGYEVEKTKFRVEDDRDYVQSRGSYVGSYTIMRGFEQDSSCGVEAITHILPADLSYIPYVEGLMDDASMVFDSPISRGCGGHISFSRRGMTGLDLMSKMRGNLAIFYSVWRRRLNSTFCKGNKSLHYEGNPNNHYHGFSVARMKGTVIELRLPDAVKDTADLKNRHKMMAVVMHHSILGSSWDVMIESLSPHLLERYGGCQTTVDEIVFMAELFREWLLTSTADPLIHDYIRDELSVVERRRLQALEIEEIEAALMRRTRRRRLPMYAQVTVTLPSGRTRRVSCRLNGFYVHGLGRMLSLSPLAPPALTIVTTDDVEIVAFDSGANNNQARVEVPERPGFTRHLAQYRDYAVVRDGNVVRIGTDVYTMIAEDVLVRQLHRWHAENIYQRGVISGSDWVTIEREEFNLLMQNQCV